MPCSPGDAGQGGPCPSRLLSVYPAPASNPVHLLKQNMALSQSQWVIPPPTLPQGVRKADTVANQAPTIPVLSLKTLAGPYLACSALSAHRLESEPRLTPDLVAGTAELSRHWNDRANSSLCSVWG